MLGIALTTDLPAGLWEGLFFAGAAILMGLQTYRSFREGYMYCGVKEKVYREKNPNRFKIWFVIQSLFVVFCTGIAINAFLSD